MAIADDDIERLRSTVSIVDVVGQYVQLRKVGRNWVGPVPVPRREDAVVQRPRGDRAVPLLRLRQVRRRVHVRPGARARRLRRRRRAARRQGRHPAHVHVDRAVQRAGPAQAARRGDGRRPSSGTTGGCSTTRPPGRRATTCAVRGLAGDVARAVQARLGARRLGRPGAPVPASTPTCCATPAWRSATGATACRTRSGRGCCSRSSPTTGEAVAFGGRVLPGLRRPGEVQELAGDADLRQVQDAVRAELGQGRHRRRRPGRRVRGLHRRDRLPPGRRASGPWRRAARRSPRTTSGCSSATPAGSCWRSTPTPPARAPPSASTSGSRSTRCEVSRRPAARRRRTPASSPSSDPEALAAAVADAAPFLGFRLDRVMSGRPARTPEDRARLAERAMAVVNEHPDANVRKLYAGQVASEVGLPVADLVRVAEQRTRRPTRRGHAAAPRRRSARTPSSSPSPCSPRTGSRSPSGSSRSCSPTRRTGGRSSPSAPPTATSTRRIEQADPEAREVLERAAVADLDVDADGRGAQPDRRGRPPRAAPVATRPAIRTPIRDDAEARVQLEELGARSRPPRQRSGC